jgi:hypothetical protein
MARVTNGILGAFVGKVGTVVGYIVDGRAYMRGVSKNPKKMTENELVNQAKFKLVQDYMAPLKDLLKAGFKGYYYTPTGGFRSAVSYTRKVALVTDDAGFYIDPALVKISGGDLQQAENPTAVFEAPDFIKITWNEDNVKGEAGTDQLMVSAYDMEALNAHVVVFDGAYRRDGSMLVQISPKFKGKQIDVHIGFVNGERTAQSDSQYLGKVEVPA